ncbi:MAG: CD225/dispanin family protein [Muribaculaceae bacterium]|nr:CD225/dispanin family protein [Muribaculaceae bacterium]
MAKYPGHDTEFFIVINGVTIGPLKGLTEVLAHNINSQTPVWYDGLDDWTPAIMAPLTRQLFTPDSDYYRAINTEDSVSTEVNTDVSTKNFTPEPPELPKTDTNHPYNAHHTPSIDTPSSLADKPRTYLGWAMVVTILCNIIAGIIALIYATKVNTKYRRGDTASAQRCSESAQWWIAIGICAGLIFTVANLFCGTLI